jgi:hypothetical protein
MPFRLLFKSKVVAEGDVARGNGSSIGDQRIEWNDRRLSCRRKGKKRRA